MLIHMRDDERVETGLCWPLIIFTLFRCSYQGVAITHHSVECRFSSTNRRFLPDMFLRYTCIFQYITSFSSAIQPTVMLARWPLDGLRTTVYLYQWRLFEIFV